jgi:hypothetical protein
VIRVASDNRVSRWQDHFIVLLLHDFLQIIIYVRLRGRDKVEKSRSKITIETDEVWIIKRKRFFVRCYCPECEREVSMVPPDEAALLACRDIGSIYSSMERDQFHMFYYEGTKPLICLNSLCSL